MTQIKINLDPAIGTLNRFLDSTLNIANNILNKENDCDSICPPKQECPPNCILTIKKEAMKGERIIVPFKIVNKHNNTRSYQIGVRPLVNDLGQPAPQQPTLSIDNITLNPRQSRIIHMTIDLINFQIGTTYQTDVVVRENKFNQNICFSLCIVDNCNTPTAHPWDEEQANIKWLGWQRHFMCPPTTKPAHNDENQSDDNYNDPK